MRGLRCLIGAAGSIYRAASRHFFGSSPENAHIQPDNLEILVNHLKCAAFELPISLDERFGSVDLPALCEQLGEAGFLHQSGGDWHWIDEAYPADTVSLRSVTSDNFVRPAAYIPSSDTSPIASCTELLQSTPK